MPHVLGRWHPPTPQSICGSAAYRWWCSPSFLVTSAAVQMQAMHLGSGWRRILEAIEISLLDQKLVMLEEGLSALALAIDAANEAGQFIPLLPHLLGLCVLAATHEVHPYQSFSGLKCIQQMVAILCQREVGMTARSC
jgi:hypothetical protein